MIKHRLSAEECSNLKEEMYIAMHAFKEHLKDCRSKQTGDAEILNKYKELEDKLIEVVLGLTDIEQHLSSAILANILLLIHYSEEHILKSALASLTILNDLEAVVDKVFIEEELKQARDGGRIN